MRNDKTTSFTKSPQEIIFKILTIFGLGILIFLQVRPKNDIVYVDSIKLLNGYTGMKEARMAYELKTSGWKSNLDSLRLELDSKIKEYQTKQAILGQKEKQLTEELLQSKQQQFLSYQQVISEKIQQEDELLTKNVISKVNDYIKKYGEERGYGIIMAATQYGNIVYSQKGRDITDEVLEGLNKEYTN